MKTKLLIAVSILLVLTSIGQNSVQPTLNRSDYIIIGDVIGESQSSRLWLLFIPFGGKSETKRKDRAYKQAIELNTCDGILQPIYTEKKVVIPLVLITFSYRKTTVKGKGYRIKVDEYKNEVTNNNSQINKVVDNPIFEQNYTKEDFTIGEKVLFQNMWYKPVKGEIISMGEENAEIKYLKGENYKIVSIKYSEIKKQ